MKTLQIEKLFEIGISLSSCRDSALVLRGILDTAMDLTECDAGTLYILENNALSFYIMVTKSMGVDRGGDGTKIDLPPVPLSEVNVCAKAALDKMIINIADVYEDDRFDFSGPRRYDIMTGYRTGSMLVIPMTDEKGDVVGVLQLLNALDHSGNRIPFPKDCEQVISSLASQAAIRLTNLNYSREIVTLLESMVQVTSTAIDARSPYNANHSKNMARYGEKFLRWLQEQNHPCRLTEDESKELLMAIWLHDMGKLVTPLEVMNKPTRLGPALEKIKDRFRIISLLNELRFAQGNIDLNTYQTNSEEIKDAEEIILHANSAGFLSEEFLQKIQNIGQKSYMNEKGNVENWLTEQELHALSVRKGTLTAEERIVMENHVVMTEKLLSQMHFTREFSHVREYASSHHELLNGTGYPRHLVAEQIPFQVRVLTILDIFDALTAKDRPYKAPMSADQAFSILDSMVRDGQLDGEILKLFKESKAWE